MTVVFAKNDGCL